jgi:hypothetical protein
MINSNSSERKQEIENFVVEYFKKYKVGYEASGFGCTQGTELASAFWGYLHKYMTEVKAILYNKLPEKTLIDLGVGADGSNMPGRIDVPFKKYIGVDIDPPYANADYAIEAMNKKGVEASLVGSDMLRFITNEIPDKSANFMLSAIDSDVILDDKYWQYLCEELYRCTEDGGIIIDAGVGDIEYYLEKMIPGKFKIIFKQDDFCGQKIFEKIS